MESNLEESLEQIKNASNRIRKYLHETPVMTSSSLNKETGLELFFKAENLQKTGSFKARGATNAVTSAIQRGGQKNVSGFVTGSSGNHGLALSWICSQLEHPVTCSVVVIKECPQNKIDAIERYGGKIVICDGTNVNSRERKAEKLAREQGHIFISSCDHTDVIAGQGTIALELLEQVPDLDAILVPVGGGGMAAGICLAVKAINPDCLVIGVEPAGKNLGPCLKTGSRLWPNPPEYLKTKAEGLMRQQLGHGTFPIVKQFMEKTTMVADEETMQKGANLAFERLKTVVELSAGAAIGAVVSPKFKESFPKVKRVGVIMCGGNVRPQDFIKY